MRVLFCSSRIVSAFVSERYFEGEIKRTEQANAKKIGTAQNSQTHASIRLGIYAPFEAESGRYVLLEIVGW